MHAPTSREAPCTDWRDHERVARVVAASPGRVGIQPPPGEWLELTAEQLNELYAAARDAVRDSWHTSAVTDTEPAARDATHDSRFPTVDIETTPGGTTCVAT